MVPEESSSIDWIGIYVFTYQILFYFVCMNALTICMNVYCMHAWFPSRSEEGIGFFGAGVY